MKHKPTDDKDLRLIATNDSGEEPRQDLARELLATRRALRAYLRHAGPGMTLDVSLVLDNAARRVLPEFYG